MIVTSAGVDTWSPSWYVDPDGPSGRWLKERATERTRRGMLVPEPILGHRVGWFNEGLLFAEGHPDPGGGLCPGDELLPRALDLQDALVAAGLPLPVRQRRFVSLGSTSEGWAGVRRLDVTANLSFEQASDGLSVLAAIAAVIRDSPGQAEVRFGADRGVETVYLRGWEGKRILGRWYDKGLEAAVAERGTMIRAEDQRRWGKADRRDVDELTGERLRDLFRRRFLPLYKLSKGVSVRGPMGVATKLVEAVAAGELSERRAAALMGGAMLERAAGGMVAKRATAFRRRAELRELGLVLADGVLEEVEVDVAAVMEAVLETDAWERRG